MKNLFSNHRGNLIILILMSLLLAHQVFSAGFFKIHDDIQVMRLYQINRCFQDGQIPCRWAPDMAGGYGQPMFNYYSASPYYLGELIKLLGFSYISVVKILLILILVGSSLAMYFLLTQLLPAQASILGASLYLMAPYRSLDVFVRGALAEAFALSLFPLVLGLILSITKKPTVNRSLMLAIISGIFFATHNITTLISLPIIFTVIIASYLSSQQKIKTLLFNIYGLVLGAGLASFFILPIVFERNLINTQALTNNYFNYRAHFITLRQMFFNNQWGFGVSEFGDKDTLSFSIGLFESILVLFSPVLISKLLIQKQIKHAILVMVTVIMTLLYLFMTHNQSEPIWTLVPTLAYLQFPWRLLGVVALLSSIVAGYSVLIFPDNLKKYYVIVVIIFSIAVNYHHFSFVSLDRSISDEKELIGYRFDTQSLSAVADYLPLSSKVTPETLAPKTIELISGNANVNYFEKRSNYFSAEIEVYSDNAKAIVPITYFENWRIYFNGGQKAEKITTGEKYGEMIIDISKGKTLVQGYFENTKIREIGNLLTFLSFTVILVIFLLNKNENV